MSMATKTLVCPECQAPAVPGRYACAQCGALLASVGLARASRSSEPAAAAILPSTASGEAPAGSGDRADATATTTPVDARPPIVVAPAWTQSLAAEPVDSEPTEDERWDDELPSSELDLGPSSVTTSEIIQDGPAEQRVEAPAPAAAEEPAPIAGADALASIAPVAAPPTRRVAQSSGVATAVAAPEPKRRAPRIRRPHDPAAIDRIAPLAEPTAPVVEPAWPVVQPEPDTETAFAARAALAARAAVPFAAAPVEDAVAETRERAVSAPADLAAAMPQPAAARIERPEPSAQPHTEDAPLPPPRVEARAVAGWPPPGNLAMAPEPAPRVPAGSYLPPSAVLPPGEALPVFAVANARTHEPAASSDAAGLGSTGASAASRLADLGLPADTPRRVVSIGAAVAALGFLLPWTASVAGNDLLGDYWARWGLAGPGHWIVAALLVALAVLCLAGGRLATLSVGLPAIAASALLLGLAWPYLFGFLGRAVGLWVVLAGLLLLVAGGLLEVRSGRHDEPAPAV
jgi:hypothetical protein